MFKLNTGAPEVPTLGGYGASIQAHISGPVANTQVWRGILPAGKGPIETGYPGVLLQLPPEFICGSYEIDTRIV